MGEKRIGLAYLIQGKEIAVVSMFSDNVQHWLKEPMKVLKDIIQVLKDIIIHNERHYYPSFD